MSDEYLRKQVGALGGEVKKMSTEVKELREQLSALRGEKNLKIPEHVESNAIV